MRDWFAAALPAGGAAPRRKNDSLSDGAALENEAVLFLLITAWRVVVPLLLLATLVALYLHYSRPKDSLQFLLWSVACPKVPPVPACRGERAVDSDFLCDLCVLNNQRDFAMACCLWPMTYDYVPPQPQSPVSGACAVGKESAVWPVALCSCLLPTEGPGVPWIACCLRSGWSGCESVLGCCGWCLSMC